MVRLEGWKEGVYVDNLIKFECYSCHKKFIVGEDMLGDKTPTCPYCASRVTEWESRTTDEDIVEINDALGCVSLIIDLEED